MYRGLSEEVGVMGGGLWCPLTAPHEDPLTELEHFFDDPPVTCSECAYLIV